MPRTLLFNKPFGVLSQFTDSSTANTPSPTLSGFIDVPGVYPAGRLDKDSEGLMVLTDDGVCKHASASRATRHRKPTGRRSRASRAPKPSPVWHKA